MYIKEVELENFKCFKEQTIHFDNGFTVIVGPNGSGKSSIIDGINFVLGKVDNDLRLFHANNPKLRVKMIFNDDSIIEKVLEKDTSNNIQTSYYLNNQIVSEDAILEFVKALNCTIIDNCGSELSKKECINFANDLKEKSKQEQVIVVSLQKELMEAADRMLGVIGG